MKSQKNTQKLYEDTLASVETARKRCVHCGDIQEHHRLGFCIQGEYSRRFTTPVMTIAALENQANILKWVLDQEDTYVSIDDCIMPETIVATFTDNKIQNQLGSKLDVFVDDLDEPYRGILLAASNKLPITLPGTQPDVVKVVSFAIFPNGSVFRNFNEISENLFEEMDKQELRPALIGILNKEVVEELVNRYGGR